MSKAAREPDASPGCSIRVVVNRTGIAADTLRVWERRYGFPKPERRAGGSRVYSEDDVARLLLVHRALAAGYRPGEVVPLPRADLERIVTRERPPEPAPAPAPELTTDGGVVSVTAIADALANDDLERVRVLLRSAALTLGPRGFVVEIAHPLAVRVGELWATGAIEVRHEHLATALLTTQLRLLFGALDDTTRPPTILLATLPGESHALPLDMVAVYLAASGASSRMLGADTPPEEIVGAAKALGADAVGVSVSIAADPRVTEKHVSALAQSLDPETELWVGGAGGGRLLVEGPLVRRIEGWSGIDRGLAALRARRAA